MNSKTLAEVKSPFTDELIQTLIEKYISCGCDDDKFYDVINNLESTDIEEDYFTNELVRYISKIGTRYNVYRALGKTDYQFLYEQNDNWITLSSEEDPMKEDSWKFGDKKNLIYRIYLNIKGIDKSDFVLSYIDECEVKKLPFRFKFSRQEKRNDQIVILSDSEHFDENLSIIEQLTGDLQLGELPMLVGSYKGNIGITEEFYNRTYSPTQIRLLLVRESILKYLCDNKDEFYEYLLNNEKKKIDMHISNFKSSYDIIEKCENWSGKKYKDNKEYYQKKSSKECAKEYIVRADSIYLRKNELQQLSSAIQKIYLNDPEKFTQEVTKNYRMIGTQVWGISEDFVFSSETEEKFMQSQKDDAVLSAKQIGDELKIMSRKGITDGIQYNLISIAEGKEQQPEIEQ